MSNLWGRICLWTLVFAILTGADPILADFAPEKSYETEIQFLKELGLLEDSFDAEAVVSKGETVVRLMKLIHPDAIFSGSEELKKPVFSDVAENHPFYWEIRTAKELHIINGDSQNRFEPDKNVSFIEAQTMMINALGYTPHAIAAGGYPSGYISICSRTGITKGISLAHTTEVKGAVLAKMLYQALFANLVVLERVGAESQIAVDPAKNILSERYGIREYAGIVTDDGITSLSGASMNDPEKIEITTASEERIRVYAGALNSSELLGHRVRVFIRDNNETGRIEVVYIDLNSTSVEKVINSKIITRATGEYLEIEPEDGKLQKLYFENLGPVVIYNGVRMIEYDNSILNPRDGLVKWIDNDGNNRGDTVIITSFNYADGGYDNPARNIVVDYVDTEERFINCKFNPAMTLELSLDETLYRFLYSGEIDSIQELQENDVVSVAKSPNLADGKQLYYLCVHRESIVGVVESVNANEVTISGATYEISSSILDIKSGIVENISFLYPTGIYLDAVGKGAYVTGFYMKKNYGYMINAAVRSTPEDTVLIDLYTSRGERNTYHLSGKALINGAVEKGGANKQYEKLTERYQNAEGSYGFLGDSTVARPVIFETNSDGAIIKIDTDMPNDMAYSGREDNQYVNQWFIPYTNEEAMDQSALKAGYRSPRNHEYRNKTRTIDGKFYINNDTVIIAVPDIDTYGLSAYSKYKSSNITSAALAFEPNLIRLYERETETQNYEIISPALLSNLFAYDMQAYDIDPDTGVAGLVVLRGRNDVYNYGLVPYSAAVPMAVFLRTTEYYSQELQKTISKIHYTYDGVTEKSAMVDTDTTFYSYKYLIKGSDVNPFGIKVEPLEKGDVIRVIEAGGWLSHLERVCNLDRLKSSPVTMLYPAGLRYPYVLNYSGLNTTGFPVTVPMDVRNYNAGVAGTYTIGYSFAKSVSGNTVYGVMGYTDFTSVNLSDPATYADQYYNLSGTPMIHISIDDTKEIKILKGRISDIITIGGADGIKNSSVLFYKHVDYAFETLIIINGLEHIAITD